MAESRHVHLVKLPDDATHQPVPAILHERLAVRSITEKSWKPHPLPFLDGRRLHLNSTLMEQTATFRLVAGTGLG
jgi:hypothetical protein